MEINVKIKYVSDMIGQEIKPPFYATEGAAGMDLSAAVEEDILLPKGKMAVIPTGIAISLPNSGYVAYIYARSGLGIKHGICLSNGVGVIDSDYRGEIRVGLINLGPEDYVIKKGERIAQMVFAPVARANLIACDSLDETQRGAGGFGSTGR